MKINFHKSAIMIPVADHRTKNTAKNDSSGIPIVTSYKYLGVHIDDTLSFNTLVKQRKSMEDKLKKSTWILNSPLYTGAARYHLFRSLFQSRVWYQLVLISHYSDKAKFWTESFLYRSCLKLFGIKGKPNKQDTLRICLGQGKNDDFLQNEWSAQQTNWLLKQKIEDFQNAASSIGLDVDRDNLERSQEDNWETLKLLCGHEASGIIKWWTSQRFNGFKSNLKCICEQKPLTTTKHILDCHSFSHDFAEASQRFGFVCPNLLKDYLSGNHLRL
jgi:hypothetical protein